MKILPFLIRSHHFLSCYSHSRDLRSIRPYLDSKTTASTTAVSIVHSKLDYCNSLYYNLLDMHHLTCGISSLLHSVSLILFTILLVHLILRISQSPPSLPPSITPLTFQSLQT